MRKAHGNWQGKHYDPERVEDVANNSTSLRLSFAGISGTSLIYSQTGTNF
jgi:hypothetical protein